MKQTCRRGYLCFLLAAVAVTAATAAELPDGFRLEPVVTGLTEPSSLAFTDDGRILIAERTTGNLREIYKGELKGSPVCHVDVETAGEAGLLGVAVPPAFRSNGWVYLYYTDLSSSRNKVSRFVLGADGCVAATDIVADLGAGPAFLRNGGGIAFGTDGKLYVATGDMETPADAQTDAVLQGKILRLEEDGAIPADNTTPGSAVFAKGVRDGRGIATSADGVYAVDGGAVSDLSADELNAVPAGGNLGWANFSGDSGGVNDDPLLFWAQAIGARGLASYGGGSFPDLAADGQDSDQDRFGADKLPGVARVDDNGKGVCVGSDKDGQQCSQTPECPSRPNEIAFCYTIDEPLEYCFGGIPIGDDACGDQGTDEPDESFVDNLFLISADDDRILRTVLEPSDPTAMNDAGTFLDPTAWPDCPTGWTAVETGSDGWLYLTATNGGGAAGGLYRVTYDDRPGPREVSPPGSPFPLVVKKGAGDQVDLYWEDLRADSMQPRDDTINPKGPVREFTVWRGDLGQFYSHTLVPGFDATPGDLVNGALRTVTIDAVGDSYFLVSGRGDNFEGPLGSSSDSVERPGYAVTDLCDDIGDYIPAVSNLWACGQDFTLLDQNGDTRNLSDYRGHPIVLDLSAIWCGPCNSEADILENLYQDYRDRGVVVLTSLIDDHIDSGSSPPGRPTPGDCRWWGNRTTPLPDHTFPCLADPDGLESWGKYGTGFLPTNVILDSGMRVVYADGGYDEAVIRNKLDRMLALSNSCLH